MFEIVCVRLCKCACVCLCLSVPMCVCVCVYIPRPWIALRHRQEMEPLHFVLLQCSALLERNRIGIK